MRHPITLLAALIVVAGVELAIFAADGESEPGTVRALVLLSCLVIIVGWFLVRIDPAAPTPVWPAHRRKAVTPYVDSATRRLETLLSAQGRGGAMIDLAELLAAHLPDRVAPSAELSRFIAAARSGRGPRRPTAAQLARWLSEIEAGR